jgi:hypothetical protein
MPDEQVADEHLARSSSALQDLASITADHRRRGDLQS